MRHIRIIVLLLLITAGLNARAQLYSNNFDNGYTWYPPWENIVIGIDSTQTDQGFVCVCDSTREFGLGFIIEAGKMYPQQNIRIQYEFLFKTTATLLQAKLVFSIDDNSGNQYWQAYPLSNYVNDTAEWSRLILDLYFPFDYIGEGKISSYIWNRENENLYIDNAELKVTPWDMPSFLPDIQQDSITDDSFVLRMEDSLLTPLTYPIGMLTEYVLDGDTVIDYQRFKKTTYRTFEYLAVSSIDSTYASWVTIFQEPYIGIASSFYKEAKLLRKALVIPFIDSTLTIYRRNMEVENGKLFQNEYYLDREGFQVGEGKRTIVSYHQTDISSTQFDATNRIAYFNLDYWRDHPMIHYPMSDTMEGYFEDVSCRSIERGNKWFNWIELHIGDSIKDLPRIMPIPYGYESGIIFTEHADWTDIRTHRATYFGSERITKASKAIGGYVYYGIPVTKSVFYNNPDKVTNEEISRGAFHGLHATIKTDKDYAKFLKQLYQLGYEICLHTPEQYTTTPSNLNEAMRYMKRHFNTVSWIDHGYNNGPSHNREDLVCDGVEPSSEYYAADLWRKYGVKYLWNAYYEENRMESWHFDNNLTQPYPGFGDALPNRQVTTIPGFDRQFFAGLSSSFEPEFLVWSTPSTLDILNDSDWDFYYSDERLQRIIDHHSVHITHVYSPWVWPGRTFWTYDTDSTIVAMPGMNRALERIAALREAHKMLPMTIKTYLDYYCGLLQVDYTIIDSEHIQLTNLGEEIKGFTLLCPTPIRFEDNRYYEFRKSGDYYYIWFDLKPYDEITIRIINN
jgi:hypothetical protein